MKNFVLFCSMIISTLALACPPERLCTGDRVIDKANSEGQVLEVFKNGKAKISLDGYSSYSTREVSDLGKGVPCHENICVGDRIIDDSNHVGKAIEVFDNGKVKVSLDGYSIYGVRNANTLGKSYRCIENFCRKDRIIDGSDRSGNAIEIFDNGKAKVLLDGDLSYSIRSFATLGISLNCQLKQNCSGRN